jgi:hypothetical protein
MGIDFFAESPVLQSLQPVIDGSRNVQTNLDAIERVASWMAYEEFGIPGGMLQFDMGRDEDRLIDVIMLVTSLNFAFSDFATSVKFQLEDYEGQTWVDSDGMFACLHRALKAGVPVLDGAWQARVTRRDLEDVFRANIEIPMLDERVAVLNELGTTLVDRFGGRYANWARTCERRFYADGNGMLERMVVDFPRFNDVASWDGREIQLFKLAQLGLWSMHSVFVHIGAPVFPDLYRVSAFADYIVPVALRLFGVFEYSEDLERRINEGVEIPRGSRDEIEIRAGSLYATALLTEAINRRRPDDMQLVIPQIDYRLWKTYHATHWPHHLTRTVMY